MRVSPTTQSIFPAWKGIPGCAKLGGSSSCIFPYLFYVESEALFKVLQERDDALSSIYQTQKLKEAVEANAERDAMWQYTLER